MEDKIVVCISSKNPVKIAAVKEAFEQGLVPGPFEYVTESVPSGVSEQPLGDKETLKGAAKRASTIHKNYYNKHGKYPDYSVGIEGGADFMLVGAVTFAFVYIRDKAGNINYTKTTPFRLPAEVAKLLAEGAELGPAMDTIFNQENSKQKHGASGLLTKGLVPRKTYYYNALLLALIPFSEPELFVVTPSNTVSNGKVVSNIEVNAKPCGTC